MKSRFADKAKIFVRAGSGGNGCISFRREKGVPRGGPNGGDGGDGGDVVLTADPKLLTLYDFKMHPHYRAESGAHGQGSNKTGRSGCTLKIKVPRGTEVYRGEDILADLVLEGDELCVAKGGRGGRGNAQFKTATRRAPRICEPGSPGEEAEILLRLKLIADVGLVGFPNAGKSTLLQRISNATPKIADYPFTTLNPNLGVVKAPGRDITFADLPGIVEGAHDGRGLGIEFLAHIERVKMILFVIDIHGSSQESKPYDDYKVLINEMREYNPFLLEKPFVVALNKIDTADFGKNEEYFAEKHFNISALDGTGVPGLIEYIREELCEE